MFVPNLLTFRQAALLFFIGTTTCFGAQPSLYDELEFLKEASKSVEVNIPGENELKPKIDWVTDEVSTGQAGIQKKELLSPKSNEDAAGQKNKKKLRYRSR